MSQPLTLTSLPLFPLASLLFPGGMLALRVFEVRYLDMVRKCHQAGAPFGIVGLRSGQEVRRAGAPAEQLYEVGTLATIEELQSPQPGLIQLLCRGDQRFRIVQSRLLPHRLWVADVLAIDQLGAGESDQPYGYFLTLDETASGLHQVLASLRERDPTSPAAIAPTGAQLDDCGWVANRWCELLPVPLELKQRLMQLDNPLVRLELVGDVLERTGIAPL